MTADRMQAHACRHREGLSQSTNVSIFYLPCPRPEYSTSRPNSASTRFPLPPSRPRGTRSFVRPSQYRLRLVFTPVSPNTGQPPSLAPVAVIRTHFLKTPQPRISPPAQAHGGTGANKAAIAYQKRGLRDTTDETKRVLYSPVVTSLYSILSPFWWGGVFLTQ